MADIKHKFIELIKIRSKENSESLEDDFAKGRIGKCIETLRTELDSFIRVMYLGRISDIDERNRLMELTLSGEKWTELTQNNKWKKVTDRDMVDKANELKGYIHYVYKFGCGFIHLSDLYNYATENPFNKLNETERSDIKNYLNEYHSYPLNQELSVESLRSYVPSVFDKISSNLACYFTSILNDEMIEM
ncbi:hypothetical protein [Reichenbachiella sp. MSK19-1]|uniref:hypothetical protein n=1 Tax=Reichenbachiella sp. MSK19-1 TaxID=1897631 RepID=UPI000E6C932F|nr:hypothetical protein [Reichenbachiella sp. MSK19-1]RJE71760.1 hypothetical protein BGP76_06640 [Reichenbachiella sp. MSK19-1]